MRDPEMMKLERCVAMGGPQVPITANEKRMNVLPWFLFPISQSWTVTTSSRDLVETSVL